jgi:antitoxin Phd
MREFSLTQLNRSSGEVVEAAFRGPIALTDRGKRKFVIIAAEDYDRLVEAGARAFHIDDMTETELEFFSRGLVDSDHEGA